MRQLLWRQESSREDVKIDIVIFLSFFVDVP